MTISMAGFTINDAISKAVSETMNMGQVMLVRGVFASIFVGLLAWQQGVLGRWSHMLNPMLLLRLVAEMAATATFLIALAQLPLANVSAVLQAVPLGVTMGAALVFGEKVGWRRWLAIAVGFAGVLIVVRPGYEGFSEYSLIALLCVFCTTVRDLATKHVPKQIPSSFLSFCTAVAVSACGAVLVQPMGGWSQLTGWNVGMLAVGAGMLVIGYLGIITAMRVGDVSFIAPYRYTSLLWSLLLGYLIFHDMPDAVMFVGAAIVVASGLYTLYREQVVGRRRIVAETTDASMAPDGL